MPGSGALRLGISQRHGGAMMLEGARLFAKVLGDRVHQPVHIQMARDYASLAEAVLRRQVELAWLPPFLYMEVTAKKAARLEVVCERNGALTYRSALLVRKDSRFHAVSDLAGSGVRLAWTDPSSAAGHIVPRQHLVRAGLDPARDFGEERFLGAPMVALAAVSDGTADLCATFSHRDAGEDAVRILSDVGRVYPAAPWRLRLLAVTEPIPSDGIVVGEHVPAEVAQRVSAALIGLHATGDGREALTKFLIADRLVKVTGELARIIAERMVGLPPA